MMENDDIEIMQMLPDLVHFAAAEVLFVHT